MPISKPGSIKNGLLTFDAEGHEGGRFHSRTLHVPSESSGITFGRGYDIKEKGQIQVLRDLTSIGIPRAQAEVLSKGIKLHGNSARSFIIQHQLTDFEITQQQQLELFKISYKEKEDYAKYLCTKSDVTSCYGNCKWSELHPAIRVILIDLAFRGDYTPNVRVGIQTTVAKNDLVGFFEIMSEWDYWQDRVERTSPCENKKTRSGVKVPRERFEARRRYLEKQVNELPPKIKGVIKPPS